MADFKITANGHIDPEIQANPAIIASIKHASPKHTHDFYEFFLITKGRCIHKVNGGEQYLAEGSMVFIRPEDTHYYDYDGDSDCEFVNMACMQKVIKDVFIYLGDEAYSKRLLAEEMPPNIALSPLEKEDFVNRYERLKVLCTIDKLKAKLQLRSLLVEILTQYFSSGKSISKREIPLWFDTLLTKMQKKDNYTSGIHKMYELSGRSVGHLNRVFKQYLNSTPTGYVNHLRLSYAKSLLLTTELSIVEVSMEAGFENLSHFYHLFKSEFNTSPSDFRGQRS